MVRILLPSSEESPANLTQTTREEELEDAYERGAAEPILPLKLWRDRVIAVGSSAGSRAAWGLARRLPVRHHADGRPARAERRYPGARIILAHAGGFLPYASHRFAELARVFRPDAAKPADILASFQRFYFDTALSSGPAALPSLKAFAGSGRILFGSDFPYAPAEVGASFTGKLDAYDGLTADEHVAISHGNARTLFPRLAPQRDTATRSAAASDRRDRGQSTIPAR